MNSLRVFNRQVGIFAAAGALLLAVIVPAIVSAAQLSERSIELSSSSADASGVTYKVNFTAPTAAGATVVDFCGNTPLIGETCTTASGFSASSVSLGTATGFTPSAVSATDANTVVITGAISAAAVVTVELEGIHNPTAAGPLYARIITYDTAGHAATYDSQETIDQDSDRRDEGGAAISINNSIGVSGAVLESLTFCVAGNDNIGANCEPVVALAGLTAPTLKLGEQVGNLFALSPGVVSEGSIYTQLSTNALSGAVVSLKSNTTACGGLVRAGAANCDIEPATTGGVTTSNGAKFGVKTTTATGVGSDANGTLVPSTGYSNSAFYLGWTLGDATGVTSSFGDPFLNTDGHPANNQNMELVFGATVTNETPAGLYSADLNLIATGKF